ncbi:ELL-associated factor 1 [Geodia barretti]|uniref:ELL-associated factor 1 n=1 Tax=Geodia barretti TaxID=519541 RepID=A0AA35QVD7_GEOBA|nr:ELL-associated factor 1 [Geodia barretti]
MAELDIPGVALNQEYRVKLGKSFTFPKENAFHTIKYDFKPLSVDNSKPGKLRVGEGDEVNMSLPVVQAESADDVAQFRGPKRPCTRECVLIINTETGEAILEKIGSSVNLKSVRDGRPKPSRDRSISPAPFAAKNQAMGKMAGHGKSPAPSGSSSSSHKHSKVPKPPAKSRPKKSSEIQQQQQNSIGLGTNSSASSSGSTLKVSGSSAVGEISSKPKKKQSKYANVGSTHHTDVQSSYLSIPTKTSSASAPSVLVPAANEPNPYNQGSYNQATELGSGQKKLTLEDSSGSSSGSGSSSSSGSSDSESEDESPAQPSFLSTGTYPGGGASGGGVNVPPSGGGVMNMPSMQPSQLANRVPPSMPVFGGSGVSGGGVPISIPPFPVQPSRNEDSSSSSGSDSDSSSGSSSGSSSDSSDENIKVYSRIRMMLCT